MDHLKNQIEFIVEIDKLKSVYRRSLLIDRSRYENDAEHSWYLAMMAVLLLEYANDKTIDLLRVLKMLLIHDLVEIDAGDTFAYDDKGHEDKFERESVAAKRLFGLLPEDQGNELFDLWLEFEERKTAASQFASALDWLAPLLHNYHTEGYTWKKHDITLDKVMSRNKQIEEGSEDLWGYMQEIIRDAVDKGFLSIK